MTTKKLGLFLSILLLNLVALAAQDTTALAYTGLAANLKSGTSDTTTLTIHRESDGTITLEERFGEDKLFGRVKAATLKGEVARDGGRISISFEGSLELGDDGSGFPPQTKTDFMCCLLFDEVGTAQGIYIIEALGKDYPSRQYGIVHLVQTPRGDFRDFFAPELNKN